MLNRSFKPAKCKTALKLTVSRMKLLKNKKDVQVKQIKRELAQMMESGQYRTARIRVEHVVREEKLKAAYELVEIYCELIVARLPMIVSQKNCPIDLKEAVASVMFASPRCSDVPELADIRKHFTAKYGKEFVSAAIELRPDSGVSRLLIEKLSVASPDGPTKMKILAAIAEEHNIKWDPEAFEEKPPEDLLSVPNHYGMVSLDSVAPPPTHDVKVPPNVKVNSVATKAHVEPPPDQPLNAQVPRRGYEYHDGHMKPNDQNAKSSTRLDDSVSTNVPANKATTNGRFHQETSSAARNDQIVMHAFPGDDNSLGRQNWNMKFKNAASAAQAAAESAERASMAARAAAEFSKQYSSEMRNKSNLSASVPTNTSSINHDHLASNIQTADRYPQKKSPEHERHDSSDKGSMKRQSGKSVDMDMSEVQVAIKPEKIPVFGDIRSEMKSSRTSSPSASSIGSDHQEDVLKEDDNINYFADLGADKQSIESPSPSRSGHASNNPGNFSSVYGEDPFVSDVNIHQSTIGMTSEANASLVFDDSGSDDDNYKVQESSLFFPSPARNVYPAAGAGSLDPWIFERETDEVPFKSVSPLRSSPVRLSLPVFTEGLTDSTVPSEPNDSLPVTFDASDGPSSESEEELDMSMSTNQSFNSGKSEGASHRTLASSFDDDAFPDRSQGIGNSLFSDKKFGDVDFPSTESSPRLNKSGLDTNSKGHLSQTANDSEECSSVSDSDNELLAFGVVKGGLRKKDDPDSSHIDFSGKHVTQDTLPVKISNAAHMSDEAYSREGSARISNDQNTKISVRKVGPDYDDDSSDDELSHETLRRSPQDLYNRKPVSSVVPDDSSEDELSHETPSSSRENLYHQKSVNQGKTSSASAFFFNSEDSEAEEDLPRKISTKLARPRPTFSRRTQPSNSVRSSGLRTTVVPDEPKALMPFTREESASTAPTIVRSERTEATETSTPSDPSPPKIGRSESRESSKSSGYKSFARDQSSDLPAKIVRSVRTEPSKFSPPKSYKRDQPSNPPSKSTETLESSSSLGKASHVHPRLPDSDDLFARFSALKQNRQ